ncbi:MAG: prepilin-type N-terminal cleavage/methylation domain-containing protein [Chthoniobacter sp.]|uniref:type II secretion system protein n=1 Tax=Chthoniobacter sp. TaxID=2510640 RepID=UPI0032ACF2F0
MKTSKTNAFTLIELLVVISIIAILAGIALPVFGEVQVRGAQTKALSNAKQIGTACKLFAMDYSGNYPRWSDMTQNPPTPATAAALTDSNSVLKSLIPDYISDETIFWNPKSAGYCAKNQPDNKFGAAAGAGQGGVALDKGENCWGYVAGLSDTSSSRWPLIADGAPKGVYSTNENDPGGVWKGKKAILIRVDISGTVETLFSAQHTIKRDDTPSSNALIPDDSAGWLIKDSVFLEPTTYP